MNKAQIRAVVEDNTTYKGRIFDYSIQFLIVLSLISFSLETLPDLSAQHREWLELFEVFCVAVFSVEYLLRIYSAEKPLKYMFSFYGFVDLLAILPFFLNQAFDLRVIRAFRIFRVFRALKMVRYNKALHRFGIAIRIVREEAILFFIVTLILIYLVSAGIYYFENEAQPEVFKSVFHSIWWAIVTLTTVGYGDVYPITAGGKIFTFFVLLIGVGIVTVPAGLVATALSKARTIQDQEEEEKKAKPKVKKKAREELYEALSQ